MGIPIAPLDPEIQISLKKSELKSIQHALIEVGGHEHIINIISSHLNS